MGKQVYEHAGLSSDEGLDYDLAITGNTVGTAAGTITVQAIISRQG